MKNIPVSPYLILFEHGGQTSRRDDVTRVDQSIQHLGRGFNQLLLLSAKLVSLGRLEIQNKVESEIVVWNYGTEASKIEVVFNVILVDFTE